jgi:glyoxylase-like metal-dependent hydrolase (beta-lactamase superfamily II)
MAQPQHVTTWLCSTCGVERGPSQGEPSRCDICEDERQYVPTSGQRWTTVEQLQADGHTVAVEQAAERMWFVGAEDVGIGQKATLVQTDGGNLLFDPPGLIDADSVDRVRALGGVAAIVASHPHMYGVQSAWSEAFDDAPVWIAEADRDWVGRWTPAMRTWSTSFEVLPGIVLDQVGGHFPGSTVALWSDPPSLGRGVLLAGDAIFPVADGGVTFLRSYPNRIPLSAAVVRRIADRVGRWQYDHLYNNFGAGIGPGADETVQRSAQRYVDWVSGANDHLT